MASVGEVWCEGALIIEKPGGHCHLMVSALQAWGMTTRNLEAALDAQRHATESVVPGPGKRIFCS